MKIMSKLGYTLVLLLLVFITMGMDSGSVLYKIENYEAPPLPKELYIYDINGRYQAIDKASKESYDYRIIHKYPVPPTLVETFICDIWIITDQKLKLRNIDKTYIPNNAVRLAIKYYLTYNWTQIPGFRPWTHWNFVRGLNNKQRERLVSEIVNYISKNGVLCPP